nr:MAK10-like protein [Tanacetum cinerariifolium]
MRTRFDSLVGSGETLEAESWLDAGQGLTTRLDVEKVSNKSHEKIAYARSDHGYKRSRVHTKPRQLFYKTDAILSFLCVICFRNPFSSTTTGDANPIRTLGDDSKPSHEGYRNTIELLVGNNVLPLRSDTIRLIDRAATSKLRDRNADESWEIIENLALYDHKGWNNSKEFVKPAKAISTPQSTSKIPDRRLLELEDQIKFLLKGAPKKVLIKEKAKSPVTKNINSISLARGKEKRNDKDYKAAVDGINETGTEMPVKEAEKETEAENGTKTNQSKELKEKKQRRHPALSPKGITRNIGFMKN